MELLFFPCSAFLRDLSLCQVRLSGDASELGTALLCSSRAGSVYVAVSRNSILYRFLTLHFCLRYYIHI